MKRNNSISQSFLTTKGRDTQKEYMYIYTCTTYSKVEFPTIERMLFFYST